MNRRDFLRPERLAQNAGPVLGALDELSSLTPATAPPPPTAPADEEVALLRLARRAMATRFEIVLPFGTPQAAELGTEAFDLLDALEAQLTVYRNTSEVSRLNRLAGQRPVPVERRLFRLLELAARISEETEGAYDITAGPLIKAWGFFKGPRRVPSEREREEALTRVGMQHVTLKP